MSTYPAPPSKPDVSLPPIRRTPAPRMSPQVVDESVLDDTPRKALEDQISDNERQARMRAKLDAIKQKNRWDESRAWTYLRDVVKDPDFQVEVEESPEPSQASLAQHQEIVRHHVTAQLAELDAELRREHPGLSPGARMALSERRDPELHRYARAIEDGSAWESKRSEPVYRYTGKSSGRSVREALNLPSKIEARRRAKEDEGEVMLVMAADGEVVDIELT
jgi:hypothetical protein